MAGGNRLVLGIGNLDRGDDGAGRFVARSLRGALPRDVEIVEMGGEATALLAGLEGIDEAFLIDASASGAPPGTVRWFDAVAAALPQAAFGMSTHGMGLSEAIELARMLGKLPSVCIVYAIEGASFEPGASLSPAVMAVIAPVAELVSSEIRRIESVPEETPCTKPR